MFAMHFVKGMHPELFQESVSVFVDLASSFSVLSDNLKIDI